MQYVTENFNKYKERLDAGSIKIPFKKYPFYCFLIGLLSTGIKSIDDLITILQLCQDLKHQSKMNDDQFLKILNFLFQHPEKSKMMLRCLNSLNLSSQRHLNIQKQLNMILLNQYETDENKNLNQDIRIIEKNQYQSYIQEQRDFDLALKFQLQEYLTSSEINKKIKQNNINKRETKKVIPKIDETMCQICSVDLYSEEYFPLQNCSHTFHRNCLIQYYRGQISQKKFPLKCPNQNCTLPISSSDINQVLTLQLLSKYHRYSLSLFAETNRESVSCCPTADCGYMFFYLKEDDVRFQCIQCLKVYCLNCRTEWHEGMTCQQYKATQIQKRSQLDDLIFVEFAEGNRFKQCPRCQFWVQKNQGCNHMTCRCSYQFCYFCGGKYQACHCVSNNLASVQIQNQRRLEARKQKIQSLKEMLNKRKNINEK